MTVKELEKLRRRFIDDNYPYCLCHHSDFDFSILENIIYKKKAGRGSNCTYNDVIIMLDTETSKKESFDIDYQPEYDDILKIVSDSKLKYNQKFKEVATYREFKSVGINLSKNGITSADTLFEELKSLYPWIFKEVAYSDIDAIYYIYNYLKDNKHAPDDRIKDNHIVAWTISIRAFDRNIASIWGHKPSTCIDTIAKMLNSMQGQETYIYIHNLAYDWVFLRKFFFLKFGTPSNQLNTKSHYPILIKWENGLYLKDSLILAQRKLEKWAIDLNVEDKKAVGFWDYDKLRNQDDIYSLEELTYIEHDTLAGVECIDATKKMLNKHLYAMPYTATGIPREEVRKIGKEHHFKDSFNKMSLSFEQYQKMTKVYHGGFTHANRHLINTILHDVKAFDFSSSYPYHMLAYKYPMEAFSRVDDCTIEYILRNAEDYAFTFKLIALKPTLKDDSIPMPTLQFSKCEYSVNAILDNGRILKADYIEIYLTEIDLEVIYSQYKFEKVILTEVEMAEKDYLPKWFRDYIFKCYQDKTTFKGGDPVLYSIAKAKLNSLYGMCVQRSIRDDIEEDYLTGEYYHKESDPEEDYQKYLKSYNNILPYQWGVWVTAYAFRSLFELGSSCETWVYSDTDSCYGLNWNQSKIDSYNNRCIDLIKESGYSGVNFNGRIYNLGVAELDGEYSEFKVQGAKRYCGRSKDDGELHITVAGVPKSGVACLKDDINNFSSGMIFSGKITGKLTHTYNYVDDIYIDSNGNETGDSIDLSPCDYLLDSVDVVDWTLIDDEEVEVQVYD